MVETSLQVMAQVVCRPAAKVHIAKVGLEEVAYGARHIRHEGPAHVADRKHTQLLPNHTASMPAEVPAVSYRNRDCLKSP